MMESTIMNGMCRCCATEGAFKDFKTAYTWMGEEEVYADMLRECFDISLSSSEHGEDGGICEVCITQLRNASNFKKQVLSTEEQFKKHALNKLFRPNIVKVEVTADDTNDTDDNLSAEEGYSGTEFEVPIKKETEEPKPKKRAAATKATTSRAKKAKTESGETSTKRKQGNIKTESVYLEQVDKLETEEDPKPTPKAKEYEKHLHNLKEILKCSNATPIFKQGGIGFMCSFCPDQFLKPGDLKKHTLNIHNGETNICGASKSRVDFYRYYIKLDITNLSCVLCGVNIDSLNVLMTHLQEKHNKVIHKDINNHIIPFKFDTERLTCCLCPNTFDRFKGLIEHMHKHYRNYVCSVCDAGYINQGSLNTHAHSHIKGNFPCNVCPKIFDTINKKKMHVRSSHTHKNLLNRCGYCNEGFREYYMKEKHLAEVHGIRNPVLKCNACEKTFASPKYLRTHVRKDHLLERKHACSMCEMKFYRPNDLTKHMVKHSGVKQFQCEVCLKCYARKKTLKEHMRIHNDDRRFKCVNCGQAFVQKCSWKSHMKSKHGEIVK